MKKTNNCLDNTINIKLVKESWNREEVLKIAFESFYQGYVDHKNGLYCPADIKRNFDKWINKNL